MTCSISTRPGGDHRALADPPPSPEFDQLESKTEMLETGIKVLDLLTPYVTRAARSACSAVPAWARPF